MVAAAIQHATTLSQHTTHEYRSVVILNDTAKNYGSTLLNDDWLLENNLADDVMTQELEFLSTDRYRAVSRDESCCDQEAYVIVIGKCGRFATSSSSNNSSHCICILCIGSHVGA